MFFTVALDLCRHLLSLIEVHVMLTVSLKSVVLSLPLFLQTIRDNSSHVGERHV